jgi:hypothetical protein
MHTRWRTSIRSHEQHKRAAHVASDREQTARCEQHHACNGDMYKQVSSKLDTGANSKTEAQAAHGAPSRHGWRACTRRSASPARSATLQPTQNIEQCCWAIPKHASTMDVHNQSEACDCTRRGRLPGTPASTPASLPRLMTERDEKQN